MRMKNAHTNDSYMHADNDRTRDGSTCDGMLELSKHFLTDFIEGHFRDDASVDTVVFHGYRRATIFAEVAVHRSTEAVVVKAFGTAY